MPNDTAMTDDAALDLIAHWLRDPEWGVGMLEDIAEVVTSTGRDLAAITHPADPTSPGRSTWPRH
jgi:hypothetical protein